MANMNNIPRLNGFFVSIILSLFLLATIQINDGVDGQVLSDTVELNQTTLFFAEGMEINPMEPEPTDEFQAITIPNGHVKDGLFGHSILPGGSTLWKDVGTWYTSPMKKQIFLGGVVEANLWAYKEGTESSPFADFKLEIMRGNEVLMDLYHNSVRITGGQDTKITFTGNFPPTNDTRIEPGTSISVRVTAKCNGGGAVLKFGTRTYPSGVSFGSNSLQIHATRLTGEEVVVEYKDAFLVPWTQMHFQVSVNQNIIPDESMSSLFNSVNMTRELHWEHKNEPGDYELFISIGYSPAQNISQQDFMKVIENKDNWFSLNNIQNILKANSSVIIFLILAFASLMIYSRHRSKVWNRRFEKLPQHIRSESRKSQKKYWKSKRNEKLEQWRESRKEQIIKIDYDDEDDEEFQIYRKKVEK